MVKINRYIKTFLKPFYFFIISNLNKFWDYRFNKLIEVKELGIPIF